MRLSEVEKRAKALKIKDTWRLSKKDLIKTIQRTEGNFDCFGSAKRNSCDQINCIWRIDCLK
jgi:hypothetical protein